MLHTHGYSFFYATLASRTVLRLVAGVVKPMHRSATIMIQIHFFVISLFISRHLRKELIHNFRKDDVSLQFVSFIQKQFYHF
jgi:hypothetical protein